MQDGALQSICRLPAAFTRGDQSLVELVQTSGVSKSGLEAAALCNILATDQSLVEAWLLWSANKRVTSGWYFRRQAGGYVVGFHPNGERKVFDNGAAGCAAFIIQEVMPYAL